MDRIVKELLRNACTAWLIVHHLPLVSSVRVVTWAVSAAPAVSPPACSSSSSALTEASLFISLLSVIPRYMVSASAQMCDVRPPWPQPRPARAQSGGRLLLLSCLLTAEPHVITVRSLEHHYFEIL